MSKKSGYKMRCSFGKPEEFGAVGLQADFSHGFPVGGE